MYIVYIVDNVQCIMYIKQSLLLIHIFDMDIDYNNNSEYDITFIFVILNTHRSINTTYIH